MFHVQAVRDVPLFEDSGELLEARDRHFQDAQLPEGVLVDGVELDELEEEMGAVDAPLGARVVLDAQADADQLLARHELEVEDEELEDLHEAELDVVAAQVDFDVRVVEAVEELVLGLEDEVVALVARVDVANCGEDQETELLTGSSIEDVH